jgi:hypothetical protein
MTHRVMSQRFDRLFRGLVQAFLRYDSVPRSPDRVRELGAARIDLDRARAAIASERGFLVRRDFDASPPRTTAVSPDDLARLRVVGEGFVGR